MALQMYGVRTAAVPGYMAMPGVPYSMPVQMVNGVQLLPYMQSLPVAAVMPSAAVQGSYIGTVPVPVIGNCVLNPCQPGVMAAPWVR